MKSCRHGLARRGAVAMLALAALSVPLASTAWACIPQPRLVVLPEASGPAGGQITVEGIGFDPAPSTAELRWNTVDGPVLGRSDQPNFTLEVTVPEASPGLYAILVLSRVNDGALGNTSRATFEVLGDEVSAGESGASPGTGGGHGGAQSRPSDPSPLEVGAWAVGGLGLVGLGVALGVRVGRRRERAATLA